jgi:hypothetical protein
VSIPHHFSPGKEPTCQLNRSLCGQQSTSGNVGEKNSKFPLLGFQPRTLYPVAQSNISASLSYEVDFISSWVLPLSWFVMNGEGYDLLYRISFGRNYMFSGANDGCSRANSSLQFFFQNFNFNNIFL